MISIGVDVGGTFTDLVLRDRADGGLRTLKTPTTPDDLARGVMTAIRRTGTAPADIAALAHGMTVATNTALEMTGARLGVITTKGFRDLLEIGRQTRPHMYDLQKDFPPPLVPRERRLELNERIAADGSAHRPVDPEEVDRLIEDLRRLEVEACAICFLFSFLNPSHEEAVAQRVRAALPQVQI